MVLVVQRQLVAVALDDDDRLAVGVGADQLLELRPSSVTAVPLKATIPSPGLEAGRVGRG